jgi:hypothetical protein
MGATINIPGSTIWGQISGSLSNQTDLQFALDQKIGVGALNTQAPITYNSMTGTISISKADTGTNGYVSAADFTTFNNKLSSALASSLILVGNGSNIAAAVAMSGDATLANTGALTLANTGVGAGTYTKITVDTKGRATAGTQLSSSDVTSALTYTPLNQVLANGKVFIGNISNVAAEQTVSGDATISNTGLLTLANSSTTRSNLGLGSSATFNVPSSGDAATGEVVKGDDTRLTNARTPTGSAGGDLTGTYPDPTLTNTTVVPGTYNNVTVDAKGRATSGSTVAYLTAAVVSINAQTQAAQTLQAGSAGSDFAINSSSGVHTFNIPSSSASNRGLLTPADWATFNGKLSPALPSAQIYVGSGGGVATPQALTGDASLSNAGVLTLNGTGVGAGAYGSASTVGTFTVNAKGQLTNAGSVSIQIAQSQVTNLVSDLAAKQPLSSELTAIAAFAGTGILVKTATNTYAGRTIAGTASNISVSNGDGIAGNPTLDLINAGTAGTYGSAILIPVITTDAKGRVTSVTPTALQPVTTRIKSSGALTTTSAADVLMTGFTITPPAGTYQVNFNTTFSHNTNNAIGTASVYAGGVKETESEINVAPQFQTGLTPSIKFPFPTNILAEVTVNGSQAIEVRWKTTNGTLTSTNRYLTILRVR